MSKYYKYNEELELTVDTTNVEDNETIKVAIVLVSKNKIELNIKYYTTKVQNNQASYRFKVQDVANDLDINIKDVSSAKLWMDKDGDGLLDYDKELIIHLQRSILQSDLFINNEILNKLDKTYTKAPAGTAVKDDEIILIQKALQKFKINIGTDRLDGKFGGDMKKAIQTFQKNYKPSHKTHKNYTIKETSEISKNDILAIDEALVDGWELKDERLLVTNLSISDKGIAFLKGYESEVKKDGKHILYNDDSGYCTIGYGHLVSGKNSCKSISNISDDFKNGLTDSQAEELLAKDFIIYENIIKTNVTVKLFQYEFDALVSLIYNIGGTNFKGSTLRKELNLKNYVEARNEFKNWKKSKGIVLAGLVKRRKAEENIFKEGTYDSTH